MQEVSVGCPKLREEWVINALCDCRDAQDWERVTVRLAWDLSLFPYSSLVSSHLGQQEANGIFQQQILVLCMQRCQGKRGGFCTDGF